MVGVSSLPIKCSGTLRVRVSTHMDHELLLRLLVEQGWVESPDLERLLADYEAGDKELFEFLEASGVGAKEDVLQAIAEARGLDVVDLKSAQFPPGLLDSIPEDLIRIYRCIPVQDSTDLLKVCLADPLDNVAIDELRNLLGRPIQVLIADPDLVEDLVAKRLSDHPHRAESLVGAESALVAASIGDHAPIQEPTAASNGRRGGWFYAAALLAVAATATSAIYLQQRGTLKTANTLIEQFEDLQEQKDLEQLATQRLASDLGDRLAEIERDLDRVSADAIRIAQLEAEIRRLEGRLQALGDIVPYEATEVGERDIKSTPTDE